MCELQAFILKDGQEDSVLESVERIDAEDGQVRMSNIFGEQKTIAARFKCYDNRQGKIVFEPL